MSIDWPYWTQDFNRVPKVAIVDIEGHDLTTLKIVSLTYFVYPDSASQQRSHMQSHLASKSLKIRRLNLRKDRLAVLPFTERRLLLLLGHASNEINVLQKLIMMTIMALPTNRPIVDHVQTGQAIIIMRILIGKLHEAWDLFTAHFQKDRGIATKYRPRLEPEATAALEYLRKHFGKGSPLTRIRNKLAFHYKDEGDLIENNFNNLSATEPWEFYLSDTVANSFYYASELVATGTLTALAEEVGGKTSINQAQAFERICDLTISVSDKITTLFGECMAVIVEEYFSDVQLDTIELNDVPSLSTIAIPFFVDVGKFPPHLPSGS